MPLSPLEYLYCTPSNLDAILSPEGVNLRLDDDGAGTVSDDELDHMTYEAINQATAEVNLYCLPRYDASAIATSWNANRWTLAIAAAWLCTRRGNGVPKSIQAMCDRAYKQMELILEGKMPLDVGSRNPDWPAWSNVIVRPEYQQSKIRVQRSISEQTPVTQYKRKKDWASEYDAEI